MKSPKNRAEYLSDITSQLADMARTDGLELLAYTLEMAALEARRSRESASKKSSDVRYS
jgi:hypothetical protein